MDFYTSLFIGTMVFLIFVLVIVGYFMSLSNKNQVFPPAISDCPDYYSLDKNNMCVLGSKIRVDVAGQYCRAEDFTQTKYKRKGTNFRSGLCAKKLWANDCKVKWDGITNNDNLCYTKAPTKN
jgi:hypothetical protein